MPVTFGSVQVVPASPSAPAKAGAPSSPAAGGGKAAPDTRDLAPLLRHLHERASRLRAH